MLTFFPNVNTLLNIFFKSEYKFQFPKEQLCESILQYKVYYIIRIYYNLLYCTVLCYIFPYIIIRI